MKDLKKIALAALLSDDETVTVEKSVKTSKKSRKQNHFRDINSRCDGIVKKQYGVFDRREIIMDCIKKSKGYSKEKYLESLRDSVTGHAFDLRFLMVCKNLGLKPFVTAQNVIIMNRSGKVRELGLTHFYESLTEKEKELLKSEVFSEAELADAKFYDVDNSVTSEQKNQLSVVLENVMAQLPNRSEDVNLMSDKKVVDTSDKKVVDASDANT